MHKAEVTSFCAGVDQRSRRRNLSQAASAIHCEAMHPTCCRGYSAADYPVLKRDRCLSDHKNVSFFFGEWHEAWMLVCCHDSNRSCWIHTSFESDNPCSDPCATVRPTTAHFATPVRRATRRGPVSYTHLTLPTICSV
eukprot:4008418-Prymnesium_polylepis.1